MTHTDNPAGRLFLVLQKAKKINDQVKMKDAWAEIFEIENNDTAEILRKLGQLNQLPGQIRKKVLSLHDVNQELHLKKLGNVESSLSRINLNARWKVFKNEIDDATLLSIEHCSDALSGRFNEKELKEEDLEDLKKKISEFKNDLYDYEIDKDLNSFIYEKISEIERAIFDYKLTGNASIQKEVESAFGGFYLNIELLSKDKNIAKKFFNFLCYLSAIIHVGEYGPFLREQAINLLGQ